MSIDLMSAVWQQGPNETVQRFVLLALANYADQEGYCWPSYSSLAERCAISRSTAMRTVKALETDGWIRRQARQTAAGQPSSNGYFIDLARLGLVAESDRGSSTAPPRVVAQCDQGSSTAPLGVVAQRHPIRHIDPSLNRQSEAVSEVVVVDGDGDRDAAVMAGRRIIVRWTTLTGRMAPQVDREWWHDWFMPINQLWARVGRDEDAAFEALAAARRHMIATGRTPFRPSAVVPYILAELDRPDAERTDVASNGQPQTVEQWSAWFAEA